MDQEAMEIKKEDVKKNRVKWDTIVVSILSVLGIVFIFIDGLFEYWYSYKSIITNTARYELGSFIYLVRRADMWQLYPVIVCVSLAITMISAWINAFRRSTTWLVVGIISTAISLGTFVIGTVAGINSFSDSTSARLAFSGTVVKSVSSFSSLYILFYCEIAVLVIILLLTIVNKARGVIRK